MFRRFFYGIIIITSVVLMLFVSVSEAVIRDNCSYAVKSMLTIDRDMHKYKSAKDYSDAIQPYFDYYVNNKCNTFDIEINLIKY